MNIIVNWIMNEHWNNEMLTELWEAKNINKNKKTVTKSYNIQNCYFKLKLTKQYLKPLLKTKMKKINWDKWQNLAKQLKQISVKLKLANL